MAISKPEIFTPYGDSPLSFDVGVCPTDWSGAIQSAENCVESWFADCAKPRVVSVKVTAKPSIRTHGCEFPQLATSSSSHGIDPIERDQQKCHGQNREVRDHANNATRIRPPTDVIRLRDRWFYVLQPPLETFLSSALHLPADPFPYQLEGIAFLFSRFAAILADEMGLGKTMQAVTAIRLLLHVGEIKSILLICPKPLVTNWQREFAFWAPEVPTTAIHGDQVTRRWQWKQPDFPVKIANYELLIRDQDVFASEETCFDLVALDEAQRIKNQSSTTSRVVRSINRSRSWALTGTPIENRSEDLVGIFEFLSAGYVNEHMSLRRLGQATSEYILRRTKDEVLTELPPKLFRDANVDLTVQQQASYDSAEQDGIVQLNDLGEGITIQHVFELVLRLKQICNFDPLTGKSSKFERLQADLEEVAASGKKAIIFSQWVNTIQQLADRLQPFQPLQYHGRVPSSQRDAIIEKFRSDPRRHVILMSYGAGSVGLNLQFASYVFLYDRWWNPAVEDQAINRAHRIGATGPVTVTRFLAMGTIEERIDQVLKQKRELFDAVLAHSSSNASVGMSQDEIFGLFDLRGPPKREGNPTGSPLSDDGDSRDIAA